MVAILEALEIIPKPEKDQSSTEIELESRRKVKTAPSVTPTILDLTNPDVEDGWQHVIDVEDIIDLT